MKTDTKGNIVIWAIVLLLIITFSRLMPHPANFTPLAALGLFGAAYMKRGWLMIAVPLGAYWLSDLVAMNVLYAQYYDGFQVFGVLSVYIAVAAIIGLGYYLFKNVSSKQYFLRGVIGSVVASILFFLITNAFSWITDYGNIYNNDISGLLQSYIAGIPFYWNTLFSSVFFSAIFFGAMHLVEYGIPRSIQKTA